MTRKTSRLFLYFYILVFLFLPNKAGAEVIATGVERHKWTIDTETAKQGITLSNRGERVKIGIGPGLVNSGTAVELMTYASPYYVEGEGVRRVTPIYRIVITPHPDPLPRGEGELHASSLPTPLPMGEGRVRAIPIEIIHHGEDLGKKSVRVWGDDDIWREILAQSVPERNLVRAKISTGTTYFAVFAHNQILETGAASWYNYKNCHCAASPDYLKGTILRVTNVENGRRVDVKVNDFGPDRAVHPDRVIDLDRAAFEHLANPRTGLIKVKVEIVD